VIQRAFWDEDLVVRVSGDTIALSPPLIASESDLSDIAQRIRRILKSLSRVARERPWQPRMKGTVK
jgi:beta-alanine--pyruvate transaminase